MSSSSLKLKVTSHYVIKVNGKIISIDQKQDNWDKIYLSQFLEYLDINGEGIIYKTNNYGLINQKELSQHYIENITNNDIVIHSIVGGG